MGASGTKKAEGVSRTDWVSTTTDAEGRFTLSSLHPLIDHQLFLKKDGLGTRIYDFPTDEAERERVDLGDLVLHPGGRIEGMVTTSTGEAIPEHVVKLRGGNGDLGRFRPERRRSRTRGDHRPRVPHRLRGALPLRGRPEAFAVTTTVLGQLSAKDEASGAGGGPEGRRPALMLELDPHHRRGADPRRSPAPGSSCRWRRSYQPRSARSGEGGRFELVGVTEAMGEELFTIVASYNWYNPTRSWARARRPARAPATRT